MLERDARRVWHPFTQHATEPSPLAVVGAKDAELELEDGRKVIDGISSWWCCLHGHGRRELIDAMQRQATELDHVLFAGCTHEPAVALAEQLVDVAPPGLSRAFYSDNGSTAVEVALKICVQSWRQLGAGQQSRDVFVALDGAYHGDTFGAMSVGDPDPFFLPFQRLLFRSVRVSCEAGSVAAALADLGERAAGVIVEPLVQGGGGMRMHTPEFLRDVRAACDRTGVPLIADEVMTGFGRTGELFACARAGISPDLMCLSKGLTGGLLPLAVTLVREHLFDAFLSDERGRAFFHGHTFTANPITCALALESLRLVIREQVPARLDAIGRRIETRLSDFIQNRANGRASNLRRTGGIVALDLAQPAGHGAGYLSRHAPMLRQQAIERGVFLRPLGNVLYAMPPACTTEVQCDRIADVMAQLVSLDPA